MSWLLYLGAAVCQRGSFCSAERSSGMRFFLIAGPLLLLTACGRQESTAEKAAEDAKAVAMVEAANRRYAPPQVLDPRPITPSDLQRHGLLDAGCSFEAEGQTDPVLVARPKRAVMKLGKDLTIFASDPGSPPLPLGTWSHYVGKVRSLRIAAEGRGDPAAQNRVEWAARLTVTDDHDRPVFISTGMLRCGG